MSDDEPPVTKAAKVLADHEIEHLQFSPARDTGGWWVAIAHCRCGYTSPPEERAAHLAAAQHEAGVF